MYLEIYLKTILPTDFAEEPSKNIGPRTGGIGCHLKQAESDSLPAPVVQLADREEALEVVPGLARAPGRKHVRGPAVAVQEAVDVAELEVGDSREQHRVDIAFLVQLVDQLDHQDRYVVRLKRRAHDLSSARVDQVVL